MTLAELQQRYPGATAFTFGDSRALCERLLALVRAGDKVATCGAVRDFESGSEEMPRVGRCDIALEWDGRPALVIETVSLELARFCDVTEAFALAEGENENLAGWREDHRAYFERNGGFEPEMMLVCERFRLLEDLAN